MRTRGLRHVERGPRIGRLAADVQKQRSVPRERAGGKLHPRPCPLQVTRPRHRVVVAAIADPKVVRGRGDDGVERAFGKAGKKVERVAEIKPEGRAAKFEGGVWRGKASHGWSVAGSWWLVVNHQPLTTNQLGRADAQRLGRERRAIRGDGVVAAVAVHLAGRSLFLDVGQ